MKHVTGGYIPGTYARRIPDGAELADESIREWKRQRSKGKQVAKTQMAPAICISRKIGVGGLEIADIVAEKIGYRVVDRGILEHIASRADLREETVALFDEKYPGRVTELINFMFGEKSYTKNDYVRHLAETVFAAANLEPTIFVGRGTHLILPRNRVLAVRCICSDDLRIKRLCDLLDTDADKARAALKDRDKEQQEFFRQVYGKTEASSYEFDLVVNCGHLVRPEAVAAIVVQAFEEKFGRPHRSGQTPGT
jgi:cytidylate kinase